MMRTPLNLSPDDVPTPARRRASVTLRGQGAAGEDAGPSLDPANQSLADALRITLKLVWVGMLFLGVLFLLSGFQTVRENERAIRLLFGRVDLRDVGAGFRFSWPYPLGELIKVDVGQQELKLDREFWVSMAEPGKPLDEQSAPANLIPGQVGSNLTADGNIAHTRWKIVYSRTDPESYAKNVLLEAKYETEQRVIRAITKRAVVRACAQVPIEEMLKQQTDAIASRVRQYAQASIDELKMGVTIKQVLLEEVTPPLYVRKEFNNVQSAVTDARKARDEAQTLANGILAAKAGIAAPVIIGLINQYELAVEGDATKDKAGLLAKINAILDGEKVEVQQQSDGQNDGRLVEGTLTGDASRLIAEARQYRSEVVTKKKGELALFQAKLAQYQSNPGVMVSREWTDAVRVFLDRPDVQLMTLPPGTSTLELAINRDPDQTREIEQRARQKESDDSKAKRLKELELGKSTVSTGRGPAKAN